MSPQVQGDFYDLFEVPASTLISGAAANGIATSSPYTFDRLVTRVSDGLMEYMPGLNYEPEHVRGRALASFSGNGNLDGGYSALWGAVNAEYFSFSDPQTLLYHRSIIYTRTVAGALGANAGSIPATVNTPAITGGIPRLGALQSHTVPGFTNPDSIIQRDKLTQPSPNNQQGTPWLHVGDDRPIA